MNTKQTRYRSLFQIWVWNSSRSLAMYTYTLFVLSLLRCTKSPPSLLRMMTIAYFLPTGILGYKWILPVKGTSGRIMWHTCVCVRKWMYVVCVCNSRYIYVWMYVVCVYTRARTSVVRTSLVTMTTILFSSSYS